MSFSVTAFKTAINEGSRPNLYKITVTSPSTSVVDQTPLNNYSFLCRSASLPGSSAGVIDIPMIAGRRLKRIGDRTFAEWTTTVLNDDTFLIRKALEDWQNGIVTSNYNNTFIGNRKFETNDFYSSVLVQQLDSSGQAVSFGNYTLENCWPSDISAIDLSYDTTDSLEEFTVTWSYDYYKIAGVTA